MARNKVEQARLAKLHYQKNKERYADATRQRRRTNKEFVKNYLTSHPCVDCGEADLDVLDFDHVTGAKRAGISELTWDSGIRVIQLEIDKCVVRCANCHRRETAKRRREQRALGKKHNEPLPPSIPDNQMRLF